MIAPGTLVGRYRVQDIIGRGASSIVYRGTDPGGRPVAVKSIREELLAVAERDRTLARFVQEARVGRMLQHPHIVEMLDLGEYDGRPYMIMDLVSGDTFDERIRLAGAMPPEQGCRIAACVLDALDYAHRRSVIHRDVKPANIVLRGAASEPVLMDFGIAHVSGSHITQMGDLLGTPAYLAPEQLRGGTVDHRSDIFAAAVMLYEASTGRRPFEGSLGEVMRKICFDDVPPPSTHMPYLQPLDAVMARALSKDPDARYESAGAFAEALRALRFEPADSTRLGRVIETTVADRPLGQGVAEDLSAVLAETLPGGIDADRVNLIREMLETVPSQEVWRVAAICHEAGLRPLVEVLHAEAPLPTGDGDGRERWIPGMQLARALQSMAAHGPHARDAAEAVNALADELTTAVIAYRGDIAERLAVAESPDIGLLAGELQRLDTIAFGLEELGAVRERRQVEAASRLIAGQILRRAAAIMEAYVTSRDPLARFDIVGMLVSLEDLIAISSRLVEDVPLGSERVDTVAARSVAALTGFLAAIMGLIAVSEELVEESLASTKPNSVRLFSGHLKQLRLIHRFGTRLGGKAFAAPLSALTERIYAIFLRTAERIIGSTPDRETAGDLAQQRLTVLYDIVADIGWAELAARLFDHVRRQALDTAAHREGA